MLGAGAIFIGLTHTVSVSLQVPLLYAMSRSFTAPAGSRRTTKRNPVVAIGVDRDGGGRDDGPSAAENGVPFVMTLSKVG